MSTLFTRIGHAIALVLVCTSAAAGQEASRERGDVRWAAWLGCWSPVDLQRGPQDVQICVVPTDDRAGVRMVTFAGDQTVLEETVIADGVKHAVVESDCQGTRQSRWAADGARLFTTTELRCEGQPAQQTSGILALIDANHWLGIQAAGLPGREGVRTRRYARSVEAPPAAVATVVQALPPPPPIATGARIDDVVEATQAVSSRAVEAWLVETEPRLAIDRRGLLKMTDAHVSEHVIDLLVALAYPRHFEVRRPEASRFGGGGSFAGFPGEFDGPWGLAFDPYSIMYSPLYSPFGPSYYGGMSPYFYPFGFYGYDYGFGGFVTAPGGSTSPAASGRGQVVNGQGYTRIQPREALPVSRGQSGDASTASVPFGASGGGSSSGGASPGGYSSGGGGGATGGGQTAVPR